MSYLPTGLSGFNKEQQDALLDISPAQLKTLPLDRRVDIALQHFDAEARKKEAFWTAVEGFATGMIPILVAFGLIKAVK